MNFLGILKKVERGVASVIPVALPILQGVNPAAGALVGAIISAINKAEQTHTEPGSGAIKSIAVQDDFAAGLAVTQDILALSGNKLSYDNDLLKEAIDAQVKMFNATTKLKASFKIEKL